MKEIKTAEELHGILLDLGKEFHRICTRHDIPYYMLGGTMLGAVRHKGFIPWDDDMDFGVPRKYFEKLKEILMKELPGDKYSVLNIQNSNALLMDIIKIQDKRTLMHELYKENISDELGINIDVFPLDNSIAKDTVKQKMIDALMSLQMYRFLSVKSRPFLKKIVAICIKVLFSPFSKGTIINFINKHLISDNGEYVANYYGAWGSRETVKSEIMGTPMLYPFEDTQLYGVAKPNEYLRSLYGDYMQLPPENKRHIHITGAFWK